jgi:uroporphyrinogen decarboxylase
MNSIDRIRAIFAGEKADRVGIVDYYWAETIAQWRTQGMGCDSPDYVFDHDIIYFHFDPRFGFQEKLISEDDEYRVFYSINGETVKVPLDAANVVHKSYSAGYPIDYTIKTRADWERWKHLFRAEEWRLYSNPPYSESWFGYLSLDDYKARYQRALGNDKFKCLIFREPFECIRQAMGTETLLLQMGTAPDLVREMFEHALDVILGMIEMLNGFGMRMDGYWVWGDIAYNQGLFFSPRMYREMLMPYHVELFDALGENVIYHTDGRIAEVLPLLIEAGVKGINPIEIKAGNDFFDIARTYGNDLVLTGGIDVRVLSTNDVARIDDEIREKITFVKSKRYIYHSDHSIPYDVSLDTYRFIIDKVKDYGSCY